jgi:hypothetical protein
MHFPGLRAADQAKYRSAMPFQEISRKFKAEMSRLRELSESHCREIDAQRNLAPSMNENPSFDQNLKS